MPSPKTRPFTRRPLALLAFAALAYAPPVRAIEPAPPGFSAPSPLLDASLDNPAARRARREREAARHRLAEPDAPEKLAAPASAAAPAFFSFASAPAFSGALTVPGPSRAFTLVDAHPQPQTIEVPGGGARSDSFGSAVSLSGSTGLAGAQDTSINGKSLQGAAYVFRNLDTATGTVNESAKLTASDGAAFGRFGQAVSLSGGTGLVGAQGAAYVFRNLDTATGTVNESAKLTASDGAGGDLFGSAVSLLGSTGLAGAPFASVNGHTQQGAAYVFRGLDTATGTVNENAKLISSDGMVGDDFGAAVSLSGSTGLVGAAGAVVNGKSGLGAVYVFRGLDTATGTVSQNARLTASDGGINGQLGFAVSLSGTMGLAGAYLSTVNGNNDSGAAYVFRGLDTATGEVHEGVKLIASDGKDSDYFGQAVSLSGSTALVGAYSATISSNRQQGAVYVFRGLESATGTITESVKLTASDGKASDYFGIAISLDGDRFLIGAYGANVGAGKSYSGTVSSVTTLDAGNAMGSTGGLSFISQTDWIIGQATSGNQATLNKGDSANVTAAGRGVYVGRNAGSNSNILLVQGTVTANTVTVGSASGSTGNTLQIASDGGGTSAGAVVAAGGITLNNGSLLLLSGSPSVSDRLGNATAVTLSGGAGISTGGLSEGAAPTAAGGSGGAVGAGALIVANTGSATSASLDFGSTAAGSAMVFSSLAASGKGAYVSILGWTGAANTDGGALTNDRLLFATDPGYTTADLANWQFSDDAGTPFAAGGQEIAYNGFFEIVPVPEPGTWLGAALLGGLALAGGHRRMRRAL